MTLADPQKEAERTKAFWASVRSGVEQTLKGSTPKIELTGEFSGKPYRAVIYHVNEVVPVRIDLKPRVNTNKGG